MNKILKYKNVPENSIISNGFGKIDYCDSYQARLFTDETIDEITAKVFKMPGWVKFLFRIRNALVRPFGLKTDIKKVPDEEFYNKADSKILNFTITERNDNELVMAENDKHLNFRTSVLITRNKNDSLINLTTIISYNNLFGRLYFWPVKPFHQIIIKSILKKL